MLPQTFHDILIAKVLTEKLEQGEDLDASFDPGNLLKEKILDKISSIQVLIFGNTSESQATEFCKRNIVEKFKTDEFPDRAEDHMDVGCLYQETVTDKNELTESHKRLPK